MPVSTLISNLGTSAHSPSTSCANLRPQTPSLFQMPRPPMFAPSLASLLVVYLIKIHLFTAKNIQKTGSDWSRLVVDRLWSGPVQTGRVTTKNRKRPVCTGPVRFFAGFEITRTGLGLGLRRLRPKTETGPDFQSLMSNIHRTSNFSTQLHQMQIPTLRL